MAIIRGTNGNDKFPNELEGTSLADQIFGLDGDDSLIGFNGDDVLEGGKGADELFGSFGFDTASYRSSDSVVIRLDTAEAFGGHAQGDTLFSIEGVIGSAQDDWLVGSDERNILRGEGGNDVLEGRGGNDLIVGGAGMDLLVGGAGADELRGDAGFDFVEVRSDRGVAIDFASGKGFGGDTEGDRFFGIEGVEGSEFNDRFLGNSAANQFLGMGGADTLVGRGGADRFFYASPVQSSVAAPDRILDFSRSQGDKMVVGLMDANEQVGGQQEFQFIGQSSFTGAGQLRWFQQGGDTIVEGNTTDATAGAELRIVLDPLLNLQASDFIFANIDFGSLSIG